MLLTGIYISVNLSMVVTAMMKAGKERKGSARTKRDGYVRPRA
jgi:hypothetical protein